MATSKTLNTRIRLKMDTAANWASATSNKPLSGEPVFDSDNKILKIGDGTSTFSNLEAIAEPITNDEITAILNS